MTWGWTKKPIIPAIYIGAHMGGEILKTGDPVFCEMTTLDFN